MTGIKRLHIRQIQPYFIADSGIRRIARAQQTAVETLTDQTSITDIPHHKALRTIAHPKHCIACVLLAKNGQLDNHDREVLYVTHVLSHKWKQCTVMAIVCGQTEHDLGQWGADQVIRLDYDLLRHYQPRLILDQLETIIAEHTPKHLLFADNDWGGGDLIRRLGARRHDDTLATDIVEIGTDTVTRPVENQRQQASRDLPFLIGLGAGVSEHELDVICEAQDQSAPAQQQAAPSEVHTIPAKDIPLEQAGLVMALGNGVKDVASFLRCAQTLGATIGGSRVVVDDGKLPRNRQIGATGKSTSASVYLAFGISGAIQHLEGIQQCNTVIAINTDEHCAMVARADYSYIHDAVEVLNALTAIAARRTETATCA